MQQFALEQQCSSQTKVKNNMNVPVTIFEADYRVAAANVILNVEYGEAQVGGGTILLDLNKIAKAPVANLDLGPGQGLVGKTLLVKSLVADVNAATNKMSVIYNFSGGVVDSEFVTKGEVPNDGDAMAFYGTFRFIS